MPSFKNTGKAGNKYDRVSPGKYVFKVIHAEEDVSRNGNDQIVADLLLFISKDDEESVGKIQDRLVFSEKSNWRIELFMKCSGFLERHGIDIGDDVDITAEDILGLMGYCSVSDQEVKDRQDPSIVKYTISKVDRWLTDAGLIDPEPVAEESPADKW